jgi:O-antigen biosynthesis protein
MEYNKILILTSAAPKQTPFSTTEKRAPIGVGYLLGAFLNEGCDVAFYDNYVAPHPSFDDMDLLKELVSEVNMVGIYSNTVCFRHTLKMLYALDYLRITGQWKGKLVAGGPHASTMPETFPDFVDHIVVGEGENVVNDLINDRCGRIVKGERIQNLDTLPNIPWPMLTQFPYNWKMQWSDKFPIYPMNTSRGCPYNCSFCSVQSVWGRKYTYRSGRLVAEDIAKLCKDYHVQGVYFREDNFFANKERLYEFIDGLDTNRLDNLHWAAEARVDNIDEDMVRTASHFGLKALYFGVESGSQRILDMLKKGITLEQTEKAFALCKKYGVQTAASVMVGVPSETNDERRMTELLIEKLNPNTTWWNVFCGLPRSELYNQMLYDEDYCFCDDRGILYPYGYDDLVDNYYNNQWDYHSPRSNHPPKISVLMPVYNCEDTIKESITSILTQTEQDFELVIVDDGSTDDTLENIAQMYGTVPQMLNREINIIENQHGGVSKALNTGIDACRGKYIARMDGDDISLPLRLERQIEFFESHPDYGLVSSDFIVMDENKKFIHYVDTLRGDKEIRERLKEQNWFCHGSSMMDAKLSKKLKYNEQYDSAQDYELWSRVIKETKVDNLPPPHEYLYRLHNKQISYTHQEDQMQYAQQVKDSLSIVDNKVFPKVSVIIPTFNRPNLLVKAINSALNQYKVNNIEVIVVNDAGVDVSSVVNIDPRIKYICHKTNKGLAEARNTGIANSEGEYIAFLDDDDIFLRNHLFTCLNTLMEREESVVYTDALHAITTGDGEVIRKELRFSYDFDRLRLLVHNLFPVCCAVIDRECINNSGVFLKEFRVHEDWDFFIRLAEKYNFYHIPLITCEITDHPCNMTNTRGEDFLRTTKMIQSKYGKFAEEYPEILAQMADRLRFDEENLKWKK